MCQSRLNGLVQEPNDSFAPATAIHTTVSREMHPTKAVQCLARPDMMALQRQFILHARTADESEG